MPHLAPRTKVRDCARRAKAAVAQVVLFPELGLCGYPPKDFLELPEFRCRAKAAMDELCQAADWNRGIAVFIIGGMEPHDGPGAGRFNSATLLRHPASLARPRGWRKRALELLGATGC